MVIAISGSSPMPSAESSEFSTSSRTVVYRLLPTCTCTQQADAKAAAAMQCRRRCRSVHISHRELNSCLDTALMPNAWRRCLIQGQCNWQRVNSSLNFHSSRTQLRSSRARSEWSSERTLSKPAMFLFSAKNSAGLFCLSLLPSFDFAMLVESPDALSETTPPSGNQASRVHVGIMMSWQTEVRETDQEMQR